MPSDQSAKPPGTVSRPALLRAGTYSLLISPGLMRTLLLGATFCLISAWSAFAGDTPKTPDTKFLLGYLAGDYRLIGQQPDSGATYSGRVTLTEHEGRFDVVRTTAGVTTHGTATIETAGEGGTQVLRLRFTAGEVAQEVTYLWRSDMDNYPRLTGYLYRGKGITHSPGLEALFHVPPTPKK